MPGYDIAGLIDRPLGEVFDFVAVHQVENHPQWEPEVLAIRKVTEGPLRAGSRAVMMRREFGRTRELPYSVVAYVPEQTIAMRSIDKAMTFEIAFHFAQKGPATTEVRVVVNIEPNGLLALLGPVIAASLRRNGLRLMRRLKTVVETAFPISDGASTTEY